ncbi:MAG: addiction module toxin RelE [Planctomycetaceae bacterium]|nr:addiction module toxin RelE [Planctomycetaceae bacterium]
MTFVELRSFSLRWDALKLDSDDLLRLQIAIMCDPCAAPVITGTGGLRKIRFAPPRWNVGKSGALRVCYVYFDEYKTVLLSIVYPKSEKDNLSQSEKSKIKAVIERIEKEFDRRSEN